MTRGEFLRTRVPMLFVLFEHNISSTFRHYSSLQRCTTDVGDWCASKSPKLNEEFMWCVPRANLKKIASNDLSLRVGNDVITSVKTVRDLDVTSDSELTMQRHVNKVASACFYHIRRLKQIRRLIEPEVTATLMSAFVLSKLDYCNAILAGLPKSTVAPLQRAQNAAARLIGLVAPRDHVTSTCTLQQLPHH